MRAITHRSKEAEHKHWGVEENKDNPAGGGVWFGNAHPALRNSLCLSQPEHHGSPAFLPCASVETILNKLGLGLQRTGQDWSPYSTETFKCECFTSRDSSWLLGSSHILPCPGAVMVVAAAKL